MRIERFALDNAEHVQQRHGSETEARLWTAYGRAICTAYFLDRQPFDSLIHDLNEQVTLNRLRTDTNDPEERATLGTVSWIMTQFLHTLGY